MNVAELESLLFHAFPREDAEDWDHVGLSVGDLGAEVRGVYVALDPTPDTVGEAASVGANVLVTHHPVYLEAPDAFMPVPSRRVSVASSTVFEAARRGVSLIAMHTNLDRSREGRAMLPALLGLQPYGSWEHPSDVEGPGLGALCTCAPLTLGALAARCRDALGVDPRVWGDPTRSLCRVATLGGSAGDMGEIALNEGVDALICGEMGYHRCLDLARRGCGVILLGHDVSEFPFVDLLSHVLIQNGVERSMVTTREERRPWWTPAEGEWHDGR